jgi:hypothetical protein
MGFAVPHSYEFNCPLMVLKNNGTKKKPPDALLHKEVESKQIIMRRFCLEV